MVQQAVDGSRGQGRFGAGRLASQDPVPGKQPADIGERYQRMPKPPKLTRKGSNSGRMMGPVMLRPCCWSTAGPAPARHIIAFTGAVVLESTARCHR